MRVPCHAMPCHAMPCHAMPCHAMPCHAMPCHAMLCHAMLCYAMLGGALRDGAAAGVASRLPARGIATEWRAYVHARPTHPHKHTHAGTRCMHMHKCRHTCMRAYVHAMHMTKTGNNYSSHHVFAVRTKQGMLEPSL